MITFLEFMTGFWFCWIVFSIITDCYVTAIVSFVFLVMNVIELNQRIKNKEIEKQLEEYERLMNLYQIRKGDKK